MAALHLLQYNNTFILYLWNFLFQKRESDVMDCCAFQGMDPHSVKLPTQTQPSNIFKFNICKYGSYKPQVHCKHVEQKRAGCPTLVLAEGSEEDAILVSKPGRCWGNPVAQLLCCL